MGCFASQVKHSYFVFFCLYITPTSVLNSTYSILFLDYTNFEIYTVC